MYDHMLIDGRNAMYRAIYAGLADQEFVKSKYDFAVIFFRFTNHLINKFRPKSIHLFWDCPKEMVWRRKIYPQYKESREHRRTDIDIDSILKRTIQIIKEISTFANCHNYELPKQEADDLIYAFCFRNRSVKSLIISSDGDFKQIPYLFHNVDLLNPLRKPEKIYQNDEIDPVSVKCLMGEKTDNIDGYEKIGPVRAQQLICDPPRRAKFLLDNGEQLYRRNRALIDLSICPYVLDNYMYVDQIMSELVRFDLKAIQDIIQRYKIRGLSGEISRTILPLKFINVKENTDGNPDALCAGKSSQGETRRNDLQRVEFTPVD